MVVTGRHQDDTVTEPDALGALRSRSEKHLGRRGVGILLEKMVLDLPGEIDTQAIGKFNLIECVLD